MLNSINKRQFRILFRFSLSLRPLRSENERPSNECASAQPFEGLLTSFKELNQRVRHRVPASTNSDSPHPRELYIHPEQIAIQIQFKLPALHGGQTLGDGQSQSASFRASRYIPADKSFGQFICGDVQLLL